MLLPQSAAPGLPRAALSLLPAVDVGGISGVKSRMATFPAALPHGPITKVVDGVYSVRSGFRMGPGVVISRTMTIVQADDGLALLNAARLSDEGHAELERIGPIKHLIKLSDSHGVDEPYFIDRYKPEVWTLDGVKKIASTR